MNHLPLLQHLAQHQPDGVVVMDLPLKLQDPDTLMLCEVDGLIEFRRRTSCRAGINGKLIVENRWEREVLTVRNSKPMAQIFVEQAECDPRVRLHARLTTAGRVAVARAGKTGEGGERETKRKKAYGLYCRAIAVDGFEQHSPADVWDATHRAGEEMEWTRAAFIRAVNRQMYDEQGPRRERKSKARSTVKVDQIEPRKRRD